jgi:aspartyl-tRNA(Asn)/glutamyl-tRNA(Gln) amidotransferase subunit C
MEINKDLIKHVASVARLELTEQEIKRFLPQLQEVVDAFSKLSQVNTDKVNASFHPVFLKDALREDVVEKCLSQKEALANTEHKKDGYFKGPKAV